MQVRDEVTKSEIAILREQSNREPLKTERLIPILNALPADKRAALVSRAIASDFGLEEEEEEKPSIMDSIGKTLAMLATSGMNGGQAPAKAAAPVAAPAGAAGASAGLGESEEV